MIATPDQRVRVFVSSTLEELAAERSAVRAAIESLRLTAVLFELGARPHPPRDLYRAYLEQSDVFVAIYGERYGWIAPDMEISGLEDELRLAAGKPRLVYVKRPAPDREPRLTALVERIEADAELSYRPFADPAELERLVTEDLALLLSERFQSNTAASVSGPRRVPAPVDRFVGRTGELASLERLLLDPETRLVTLTGPGGVGKTRVALEAARRVQRRLGDDVAFVPLDDVSEGDGVLPAIRERLAIPGSGPAFEAIVRHLDGRDVLLVLDNFEHVLDAAADISGLLEQCARLTALVTTRVLLRVRGEHDLTLRPLDPDDAVELFLTRADAQSADFPLDPQHHDLVAEICERLEGLPLAVEIAVAQLRVLSPAALLEGLHRVSSTRAGPAYPRRQQTVRATIAWSVDLLDADTRRAFAHTSVFHGGFTLTAFEDVCASGRDAQALLASLVESSLVVREPDQAEYRVTTLNVVREYAEGLLAGDGATAETRDRHANHYLRLVEALSTSLRSGDHRTSMARLDRELYNIRSALDWTVDRGDGNAVAAAAWALMPYWAFRELSEEGRGWMEDIAERGALLPAARARALAINGFLRLWRGDYAGAAAVSAQALQETRMLSDEYGAAHAEMVLGILQCIGGDVTVGLELLEHARASFDRVGDEWGVSMALIGIVWGMNAAGTDSGIELYEETLARAAQLGFEAETLALGALGRRHALRGEHDVARRQLVDALRRVQAIDARLGIALYVDLIADIAAAENEGRIAARLGAAATVIAQEVGAPIPGIAGDRTKRLELLGRRLGTAGLEEESEAGRMLSADQAARDAIAWAEEEAPP